ncbi:MAG: Hpt domain-containing protein, partial [Candidatus Eremiobacteraeota bacterium]|nr:Hpt domain-containing protein [Candidatus Eremiobacteraeota bacterium]
DVGRLCTIFLEDTDGRLERLTDAIRTNDFKRVRDEAHAVKGSVANFDARQAMQASSALESERDSARLGERYARFAHEIHFLQHIVRNYAG